MSLSKLFVIFCPTVQDKVQNNEFPQSQFCLCGLFDAKCICVCGWRGGEGKLVHIRKCHSVASKHMFKDDMA